MLYYGMLFASYFRSWVVVNSDPLLSLPTKNGLFRWRFEDFQKAVFVASTGIGQEKEFYLPAQNLVYLFNFP